MNKPHLEINSIHTQLQYLATKYSFTDDLIKKFERYAELLIEWNKKFNLTAITDPAKIYLSHFDDSLALINHLDFKTIQCTADVGTGGGFPGLPLKIIFPHLTMILIEVNNKKRLFLEHVITELALKNVIIYPFDWRTFLRTTNYPIDYFFARASLQPEELVRIFKPICPYKNTTLIYWASKQWCAEKSTIKYIQQEIPYTTDTIHRKFIVFKQKTNDLRS